MSMGKWGEQEDMSAKDYERTHGEKRTPRRIVTPAGVAFAIKQKSGEYRIYRMDQFLGVVTKYTRPTCWIASLPDGNHIYGGMTALMSHCVKSLQMTTSVSNSITDIGTKHYAEELVRKHGAEGARDMTIGPARKAVEQFIDVYCPACSLPQTKGMIL